MSLAFSLQTSLESFARLDLNSVGPSLSHSHSQLTAFTDQDNLIIVHQNPAAFEQLPTSGALTIDHVAHWVPDLKRATQDLRRLGFSVAPYSEQFNQSHCGEITVPAGASNRCVMLTKGYLEFLTPTEQTDIGQELCAGIKRYTGVHLLAFGSRDTTWVNAQLNALGLPQRPLVNLQRTIENELGVGELAKFTVTRATKDAMPEGRIQCLTHHTPHLLWQPRYMNHQNRVLGLRAVLVVVENLSEAQSRYARYLRCTPTQTILGTQLKLERGAVFLMDRTRVKRLFGINTPSGPSIFGYALQVDSIRKTSRNFKENGCTALISSITNLPCFTFPESMGGHCLLTEAPEFLL